MRVLALGTYDVRTHPRVQVLIDGLRTNGHQVTECNEPLGLSTADRVEILKQPRHLPRLLGRLGVRWLRIAWRSRRLRGDSAPECILVGYMGHFDVVLARALYPRTPIVLDHLIFAASTAVDRGVSNGLRTRALSLLDRVSIRTADVVMVDVDEHREVVPVPLRERTIVVPVGATQAWFEAGERHARARRGDQPLSLVFFGLFIPLQGTPVIARALRLLNERGVAVRATLIGTGQESEEVRAILAGLPDVTWHDWVDGADLPDVVAAHDVCLGIFGSSDKARRVVPNKVYQGAAAGTAVVTSDTPAQRRAFGDAAVLVPPGDAAALADALAALAVDRGRLVEMSRRSGARAREKFTAAAVTAVLARALED